MTTLSRTLKSTVFISTFFAALPALAQDPAPVPAPEGDVAPAPVELEEEGGAAAPAPVPDAPAAGAEASGTLTVDAGATAATTTVAADTGPAVVLGAGKTSGPASAGGVDVGTGGWSMSYHGYFRAPMRIGIGQRDAAQRTGLRHITAGPDGAVLSGGIIPPPGSRSACPGMTPLCYDATTGVPVNARDYDPEKAYKKTTFHNPQIPDDQYLSWQSTRHNATDWAEMFFGVGNGIAEGTLSIEGYNFAQSSFADPETQFGIAQGYITVKPELPFQNFRLIAKVGSHWGRYGMAGRYDAGEYDTYQFGRTKVMGGTLREEIDVSGITLAFEEGFGTHKPHPSKYNTGKFTLLAHGHAYLTWQGLTAGMHLLHAWAQEEDRDGQGCPGPAGVADEATSTTQFGGRPTDTGTCATIWGPPYGGTTNGTGLVYQVGGVAGFGQFADGGEGNVWLPDGSMTILGPEIKWETGPFGLIYLGYSFMNLKNALTVGNAVEVLHSDQQFALGVTNNFLDNPQCNPAKGECSSGGTGQVHTIEAQYEFSLHNMLKMQREGTRFWGEGWDVVMKLYGMYSQVKSEYDVAQDGSLGAKEQYGGVGVAARAVPGSPQAYPNYWVVLGDNYSDHSKLKFGVDLFGNFLPAMGAGVRFDRLQPNSNIPEQAFMILSPRLEFRSKWVTREKISLQYSRYFYTERSCDQLDLYDPLRPVSPNQLAVYDQIFDYTGGPQNFTGMPANQKCVQIPSGPKLPDGWGATALEATTNWRGAPITGGNPNQTRPDVNVIKLEASMWW